jgi:radical SAM superfamily enzyme YgiQ (UPF0313 family)
MASLAGLKPARFFFMANVLLISTYELGHQPFGLASPAAWLKNGEVHVDCLDLAVQPLNDELVTQADLIALYLPMHTATRLAIKLIPRLKHLNPSAHLTCYGLYAPPNEEHLRQLGVQTILGGEFETGLLALSKRLSAAQYSNENQEQPEPTISLQRQDFRIPDRGGLPVLNDYAQLVTPDGSTRLAGYTEASRGCKHLCRHCPIVPVYNGRFRIVQKEILLADIRQQVMAGAQHITFGDPDFLNGPGHAISIIAAMHSEFPELTYDVTIKVEHLLKYDHLLPILYNTGCLFVTSAVEAVDNRILSKLEKGHTRADFEQAAVRLREEGLGLNPTFVAFTPWTTTRNYLEMLSAIRDLDLIENTAPIQYAIRLLIPAGSRLLELHDVQSLIDPYDHSALYYPWRHPDPQIDLLYERVYRLVYAHQKEGGSRRLLLNNIWLAVLEIDPELEADFPRETNWDLASSPVPRLSESWY